MQCHLPEDLDLEFDEQDNIVKILTPQYSLSLQTQFLVDWTFQKQEIKTWQIHLIYNDDIDKDFTTKFYYLYSDINLNFKNKLSILNEIRNLYIKIFDRKITLSKKDLNPTNWIRCEELLFNLNL